MASEGTSGEITAAMGDGRHHAHWVANHLDFKPLLDTLEVHPLCLLPLTPRKVRTSVRSSVASASVITPPQPPIGS
jgi:hypothetical protein